MKIHVSVQQSEQPKGYFVGMVYLMAYSCFMVIMMMRVFLFKERFSRNSFSVEKNDN